jgi:hypothetical protein
MKEHHLNKVEMAKKMESSRSAFDRLLEPEAAGEGGECVWEEDKV